ncbi:unnamed protein product [Nippostrongylus brasiliensis]|uniref:Uncharacterized protein n=1 Tax=Nippostrongylus brasiliensis TaxID=27835 RepID=A0A0N4YE59_NIPBR|nr:unnamed protein product [Nippostrongylus brasiliensis]
MENAERGGIGGGSVAAVNSHTPVERTADQRLLPGVEIPKGVFIQLPRAELWTSEMNGKYPIVDSYTHPLPYIVSLAKHGPLVLSYELPLSR